MIRNRSWLLLVIAVALGPIILLAQHPADATVPPMQSGAGVGVVVDIEQKNESSLLITGVMIESEANVSGTTPSPTPALWNDTRRESVGLPADGFGNPCCKHCTPTPTPTGTPVPEFPCPLRSGC